MLTSVWNFRDNRSGHASTSRSNYFSSHREVRTQGVDIFCMSSMLIIAKQIWKWLLALWIHAYICNNPPRWWRIVYTEWHGNFQEQYTEYAQRKTESISVLSNLKRDWHRSCWSKSAHLQHGSRRDVMQCSKDSHVAIILFWTLRVFLILEN